jgi:hypothetical protein
MVHVIYFLITGVEALVEATSKTGQRSCGQVDEQAGHGLAYMPYAARIFHNNECATVCC